MACANVVSPRRCSCSLPIRKEQLSLLDLPGLGIHQGILRPPVHKELLARSMLLPQAYTWFLAPGPIKIPKLAMLRET